MDSIFKKDKKLLGAQRRKPPKRKDKFIPTKILDGFILKVDTREQYPLFGDLRKLPKGLVIVRDELITGDYSVVGYEDEVCIERKMQGDFETFIGAGSKLTVEKLERMSKMFWSGLVIEEYEEDLYELPISKYITREMVRNRLASIRVHYGVHVLITPDRTYIERFVLDHLMRAYKYLSEGDRDDSRKQ
jgi:ERCC4-type nuclease